jgi:hypothetical protein
MKTYIKPDISFQKLDLTTNVSASCEYSATFEAGTCRVEIPGQPGLYVFQETSGCMVYSPELGDLICYHIPTADSNVFES